jgi:hypothetical protein
LMRVREPWIGVLLGVPWLWVSAAIWTDHDGAEALSMRSLAAHLRETLEVVHPIREWH